MLLLDEVLAGLEANGKRMFTQMLSDIHARYKLAILIIEHDIETISTLCPRVAVLDFGRLIADGTPESVFSDPDVVASYTGRGHPCLRSASVRAGYGAINVLWDVDLRFDDRQAHDDHRTQWRRQDDAAARDHGPGSGDARRNRARRQPASTERTTWRMPDHGIALIPEGRMIFRDMSVDENLLLGAYPARATGRHRAPRRSGVRDVSATRASGASSSPVRSPAARRRCWRWRAD